MCHQDLSLNANFRVQSCCSQLGDQLLVKVCIEKNKAQGGVCGCTRLGGVYSRRLARPPAEKPPGTSAAVQLCHLRANDAAAAAVHFHQLFRHKSG